MCDRIGCSLHSFLERFEAEIARTVGRLDIFSCVLETKNFHALSVANFLPKMAANFQRYFAS